MTQSLSLAQSRLLVPSGLDSGGLDRAFSALLGPGIDFGDLYFQHSRRESRGNNDQQQDNQQEHGRRRSMMQGG